MVLVPLDHIDPLSDAYAYLHPSQSEPSERQQAAIELLGKLDALGSAHQIALFFAEQGIKATPNRSASCAVAVFLQRELHAPNILVGSGQLAFQRSGGWADEYVRLPANVREFISRFDNHEYPELIDPTSEAKTMQKLLAQLMPPMNDVGKAFAKVGQVAGAYPKVTVTNEPAKSTVKLTVAEVGSDLASIESFEFSEKQLVEA